MSQLNAIVDQLLSGVSSALLPQGLIADQILPTVKAAQDSGKLAKYGTSHLRIEVSSAAGRGAYRRVESIARSTSSFQMEKHGLEGLVTEEDYRNVQVPYDAERDETMGLTSMLALEFEKAVADNLTDSTVVTQNTSLSGTSQFNDFSNSDPVAVSITARAAVKSGCGLLPNFAAMDEVVFNVLRFHPQMLDALGFKYARPGGLKGDEIAVALGVDRVLIAQGMYESAKESQTSSLASVWGKHILFGNAPLVAAPYQVSPGYIVRPAEMRRRVTKYSVNNPPFSTGITVDDKFDILLSNIGALYLIKNAIA